MLTIPIEKLAFIIEKAREFDAEVAPVNEDSGPAGPEEDIEDILEDTRGNPTHRELADALDGLNEDERSEMVALMWLGRGDFTKTEWNKALALARARHNGRERQYLMGTPLLSDYLEEAVSQLGYSLEEFELGRL
jgi:Protein of unknown function (DUF3775)